MSPEVSGSGQDVTKGIKEITSTSSDDEIKVIILSNLEFPIDLYEEFY